MLDRLRRRRSRAIESRLVWILGSPRSGSTWLLQILNEHESIRGLDEPLIGEHLAPILSDRPGFHAEDLDLEDFTWHRLAGDVDSYFFAEGHRAAWLPALGELLRSRFQAHMGDTDLLAIKEPNGTQAADMILAAVPGSRLIFLLRDGRDVVDSELAAFMRGSWMSRRHPAIRGIEEAEREAFVVQSAHKWLWRTQVCEQAMLTHERTFLLRYEELRQEPALQLRRLFEWLTIRIPDTAALAEKFAFDRAPKRGAQEFHRAASPGAWRENLRPCEQQAMLEILGPKLDHLGYR